MFFLDETSSMNPVQLGLQCSVRHSEISCRVPLLYCLRLRTTDATNACRQQIHFRTSISCTPTQSHRVLPPLAAQCCPAPLPPLPITCPAPPCLILPLFCPPSAPLLPSPHCRSSASHSSGEHQAGFWYHQYRSRSVLPTFLSAFAVTFQFGSAVRGTSAHSTKLGGPGNTRTERISPTMQGWSRCCPTGAGAAPVHLCAPSPVGSGTRSMGGQQRAERSWGQCWVRSIQRHH